MTRELEMLCHGCSNFNELYLRRPCRVEHIVDENSPMAHLLHKSDSKIACQAAELNIVVQGRVYGGRSCYSQRALTMDDIVWEHQCVQLAVLQWRACMKEG